MILANFNPTFLFLAITLGLLMGLILTKNGKVDKSKIAVLDYKEFMETKRKGTLVDIRRKDDFEKEKIVGAKNMPGRSGAKDSTIRKDIPIFIYDENGRNSYSVAKAYVKAGACMVYCLKNGYQSYANEKKGNAK